MSLLKKMSLAFEWIQRTALLLCTGLFMITFLFVIWKFHRDSTLVVPSQGGTYIEGSVGQLKPLIPWFTVENDVNRDIVSLVFSGLLRYDPHSQEIVEDLASMKVSPDGRLYTLTLKDDLFWHDSTEENPHPVTLDDVFFTFETIQHKDFPNPLLQQNFEGVELQKIDERTIRFKLEQPYVFFASNLTLGLLPKRSFEGLPVSKFDQMLDFGFAPIGSGPYSFKGLVQTELSTEVTLERFSQESYLDRVVFRIFPDYSTLLSDIRSLDGIRLAPHDETGKPVIPTKFAAQHYTLPQYVALFFNLSQDVLKDPLLRLGLQLGTNKQELIESIGESSIVDTPLLEIDNADWRYNYDSLAAQGALFASDWHLPEKVRLQRLLEKHEANAVGALQMEPIVLLASGASLTVTGSLTDVSIDGMLNESPLEAHPTLTGAWIAFLPTHGGTGSIAMGESILRLKDQRGRTVDSFYIWRTDRSAEFKRASTEQDLLDLFLASRNEYIHEHDRITVQDLYLDKGMLRRRLSTDPRDIRVNDAGDRLSLRLVTSSSPPQYAALAKKIADQWSNLGVHVGIEIPDSREEFERILLTRDYDVLLFGQSLLDNLDSYPYWHTANVQRSTDSTHELRLDAYNLSQYSSLEADSLLELVRHTTDEDDRTLALTDLRDVLKKDVPAVFLYSPFYTFAVSERVKGVDLGSLSLHSDRLFTIKDWYVKNERIFKEGSSWTSIFSWLLNQN